MNKLMNKVYNDECVSDSIDAFLGALALDAKHDEKELNIIQTKIYNTAVLLWQQGYRSGSLVTSNCEG